MTSTPNKKTSLCVVDGVGVGDGDNDGDVNDVNDKWRNRDET